MEEMIKSVWLGDLRLRWEKKYPFVAEGPNTKAIVISQPRESGSAVIFESAKGRVRGRRTGMRLYMFMYEEDRDEFVTKHGGTVAKWETYR